MLLGAVLVADEDPALLRAGHQHREHHALEDEVRLLREDLAVLERSGLGLVGVADRVVRLGLLARDDLPLLAGSGPAPPIPRICESLSVWTICWGAAPPRAPAGTRRSAHRRSRTGRSGGARPRGCGPRFSPRSPARAASTAATASSTGSGRSSTAAAGASSHRPRHDTRRSRSRTAAVALLGLADAVVGAGQPAREVVADRQLHGFRRRGAEVRIEGDEPLDLVQRPAHVARERDELLARQPADAPLDGGEGRDQAGARELPGARLGSRIARLHAQPRAAVAVAARRRDVRRHRQAPSRVVVGSCRAALPARSIRTAQNLNSGIFPIGLVDREEVRGRLAEMERHEARARRVAVRQARAGLDRPAPGADADEVAVADPHRLCVARVQEDVRLGLDRVQRERAPRHRAGVPVLEQPAGVEDERELPDGSSLAAATRPAPGARGRRRCRSARRTAPPCRRC